MENSVLIGFTKNENKKGANLSLPISFYGFYNIYDGAKFARRVIIIVINFKLNGGYDNTKMRYNTNIDTRKIEAQFFASLDRYGIKPRDNLSLVMDGKIHRFPVEGDRGSEKTGAYKIFSDGVPVWFIKDFRQHNEMIKCKFDLSELDKKERDEIFSTMNDPVEQQRKRAEKAEKEKLQKESEIMSIKAAWQEYIGGSCSNSHPYISLKHLGDFADNNMQFRIKSKKCAGDFGNIGDLMIPLYKAESISPYDCSRGRKWQFQSIQFIRNTLNEAGKYQKGFYGNVSTKGACFPLIPYNTNKYIKEFFICEGVATGISIYRASDYEKTVICAMSCSNIENVAKAIRENSRTLNDVKIFIAADNDDAGLKAAIEAKEKGFADKVRSPREKGTDFNDDLIMRGVI